MVKVKKLVLFAIVLVFLITACDSKPTSLPPTATRPIATVVPTVKLTATAITEMVKDGFVCYEPLQIYKYEDSEGSWVDFLRPFKTEGDIQLPWVVTIEQAKVNLPNLAEVRMFCILKNEDPGYGRGPHYVSVVEFIMKQG